MVPHLGLVFNESLFTMNEYQHQLLAIASFVYQRHYHFSNRNTIHATSAVLRALGENKTANNRNAIRKKLSLVDYKIGRSTKLNKLEQCSSTSQASIRGACSKILKSDSVREDYIHNRPCKHTFICIVHCFSLRMLIRCDGLNSQQKLTRTESIE